jgi:hypothetical protein
LPNFVFIPGIEIRQHRLGNVMGPIGIESIVPGNKVSNIKEDVPRSVLSVVDPCDLIDQTPKRFIVGGNNPSHQLGSAERWIRCMMVIETTTTRINMNHPRIGIYRLILPGTPGRHEL